MTTTQNLKATEIKMRNGFDHAHISIEHSREDLPTFILDAQDKPIGVEMNEGDVWRVYATGFYATSHGERVGDAREHSFTSEVEARDYANGWVASLKAKGYVRYA